MLITFRRWALPVLRPPTYTTVTADHVVSKHGATKSDPHKSKETPGGCKQPSTVEVRGRAQRAEGLVPPKLVKSLEPARTPVTSYQLPVTSARCSRLFPVQPSRFSSPLIVLSTLTYRNRRSRMISHPFSQARFSHPKTSVSNI